MKTNKLQTVTKTVTDEELVRTMLSTLAVVTGFICTMIYIGFLLIVWGQADSHDAMKEMGPMIGFGFLFAPVIFYAWWRKSKRIQNGEKCFRE